MANKMLLILSFIVLLFANACKDDNNPVNETFSFFSSPNTGGGYDLIENFERPNLMGLVQIDTRHDDRYAFDFDGGGTYTHYQGTSFGLSADIANPQRTEFVSLSPASIVINAFQLSQYAIGQYNVPSYTADENNLENYFGNGYNKIIIDSNQYFNRLVDSVSFETAANITNIQCGQSITRGKDLVINFTGGSSTSLVTYYLIREDNFEQIDTNTAHIYEGVCNMEWNTGKMVMPVDAVDLLKSGYYELTISIYEPKYIPLSNGKELCVIGLSAHNVTIKIED